MGCDLYYLDHNGGFLNTLSVCLTNKCAHSILLCPARYIDDLSLIGGGTYLGAVFEKIIPVSPKLFLGCSSESAEDTLRNICNAVDSLLNDNGISSEDIDSFYLGRDGPEFFSLYLFSKKDVIRKRGFIEYFSNQVKTRSYVQTRYLRDDLHYSDSLIHLFEISGAYDLALFTDVFLIEDVPDIIFLRKHLISYDCLPNNLTVDYQCGADLNKCQLVMCNSYTINSRSFLEQNRIVLLYQLLVDYYGDSTLDVIFKFHPNNTAVEKKQFSHYMTMNSLPVDFLILNSDIHIHSIISISTNGSHLLKREQKVSNVIEAGSEFLKYKDIIHQIDFVCFTLNIILKKGMHPIIDQHISKSFFDDYVAINYPQLVNSSSNKKCSVGIYFDYQITDGVVRNYDYLIVLSNSRNVHSCSKIIDVSKAYHFIMRLTPYPNSKLYGFNDSIIVCGSLTDEELHEISSYHRLLKQSLAETCVFSVPFPPLIDCDAPIDAFDPKMNKSLKYNQKRSDIFNDNSFYDWLYGLAKNGVDWALSRYYQIVSNKPQYYPAAYDLALKHFGNPVSKRMILVLNRNSFPVDRELLRMTINDLIGCNMPHMSDVVESLKSFDFHDVLFNTDFYNRLLQTDDEYVYVYFSSIYSRGTSQPADYLQSSYWLRKAAAKNPKWSNELFDILWKINTPESSAEMVSVILPLAEKGDTGSMGRLGRAYRDGRGVAQDLEAAAEWLRKAAAKNPKWGKELTKMCKSP